MSNRWQVYADLALAGERLTREQAGHVLAAASEEMLALLDAAFRVRLHYFGHSVQIHVLENAKTGDCPEDCGFCSQSRKFGSPGGEAPMRTVEEIVEGARRAVRARAKRYCIATATHGPSARDLDVICEAAQRIKAELDVEVCASLGFLNQAKAQRLVEAGVDRFNHNLETSERYFSEIVHTHQWKDRVRTVETAREAGMSTCCGGIIGLGENDDDVIDLAYALRDLQVNALPVNFLDPRPGTPLCDRPRVEPLHALRVLCMFRFINPSAELRVAGGREVTLRSLQAMALYPANSIFTSGYLTTGGAAPSEDHQMIRDLGFEIDRVDPPAGRAANERSATAPGPERGGS